MDIENISDFIKLNSPLLFLGAGFNYGLKKEGVEIPLGDSLIKELIETIESNGVFEEWDDFQLQDIIEVFSDEIRNSSFD